ncbi:MAG: hypothetical protein JKX85_04175 [Phycisphaeraceae bacterium]|nr:hypothetical protein [Phycisphaeraceae bacterium]
MKIIGISLIAIILVNLLAAGLGVAWLGGSGRISKGRLHAAAKLFKLTIEDEKIQTQEQAKIDAQEALVAKDKAKMLEVAQGTVTVQDRLDQGQVKRDMVLAKAQRLQREMRDMSRNLAFAKAQLVKEKKEFNNTQLAFAKSKKDMEEQRLDADFERVVQTYANLKPKLAKQAFMDLIKQNKMDQVVQYLAAMQLRKSVAILNQFKADEEVPVAAGLLELLRMRGVTSPNQMSDDQMPLASK